MQVEDEWADSTAGRLTHARDTLQALANLQADQRAVIADLMKRTAGGGLADRPRLTVVDALSGTLLALTDALELRRLSRCTRSGCMRGAETCQHGLGSRPGLTPRPATAGYRPGRVLDRFVRTRDRRCRFPGCRNRVPRGGELDHDRRWPEGLTAADNLTGYCTRHHRGKHQAPGWHHELHPDGRLTVTTPTGLTTTTDPEPHPTTLLHIPAQPADDLPPF